MVVLEGQALPGGLREKERTTVYMMQTVVVIYGKNHELFSTCAPSLYDMLENGGGMPCRKRY